MIRGSWRLRGKEGNILALAAKYTRHFQGRSAISVNSGRSRDAKSTGVQPSRRIREGGQDQARGGALGL